MLREKGITLQTHLKSCAINIQIILLQQNTFLIYPNSINDTLKSGNLLNL